MAYFNICVRTLKFHVKRECKRARNYSGKINSFLRGFLVVDQMEKGILREGKPAEGCDRFILHCIRYTVIL